MKKALIYLVLIILIAGSIVACVYFYQVNFGKIELPTINPAQPLTEEQKRIDMLNFLSKNSATSTVQTSQADREAILKMMAGQYKKPTEADAKKRESMMDMLGS